MTGPYRHSRVGGNLQGGADGIVIADLIRNPEVRTGRPSYWLQGSIHRVGADGIVIADLIRPFIGTRTIRRLRLCAKSAHAGTA